MIGSGPWCGVPNYAWLAPPGLLHERCYGRMPMPRLAFGQVGPRHSRPALLQSLSPCPLVLCRLQGRRTGGRGPWAARATPCGGKWERRRPWPPMMFSPTFPCPLCPPTLEEPHKCIGRWWNGQQDGRVSCSSMQLMRSWMLSNLSLTKARLASKRCRLACWKGQFGRATCWQPFYYGGAVACYHHQLHVPFFV